jgi:ABC-2 type transport system ATP-binding protein
MEYTHMIQTQALARSFREIQAVKNVSLDVPAGVVYGFLGPNGAGKTTTIRMILGLIRPTSGTIRLMGEDFTRRDWKRLAKVGALVEAPSLYPHLTGRENLEVVRRMLDLPKANVDRVLATVGLTQDANRLVRQYSLGMQQRLALALAMVNDPALLVLDEPTNGLDPSGIQEIRAMIRDMPREHGVTVFLSSHLLSEVELMATHVGIIQKGSLLYQGKLDDLKKRWGPVLQIEVDRVSEAAVLLTGMGWDVRADGSSLVVRNVDAGQSPEINQALLQRGFVVRQFALRQAGLEEMFLDMTANGRKA